MKKCIIGCLLVLMCFAACQSTPEKMNVIQKGTEKQIIEFAEKNMPFDAKAVPEKMTIQYPDGSVGEAMVCLNCISGQERFTLQRVTAADYHEDFVKMVSALLAKDLVLFPIDGSITYDRARELLENLVEQEASFRENDLLDVYYERVAELNALLETAPKKLDMSPTDYSMEGWREAYGYSGLYVSESGMSGCHDRSIYVCNNDWNSAIRGAQLIYTDNRRGFFDVGFSDVKELTCNNATVDGIAMTVEQAADCVQRVIDALDLQYSVDDVLLAEENVENGNNAHRVFHVRCSPCTQVMGGAFVSVPTSIGGEYGHGSWAYEQLHVYLDDGGILQLQLCSPVKRETLDISVGLLPWEQISDNLQSCISRMCVTSAESIFQQTIRVDKIVLGTQRIVEKDNTECGLLLPVWCVYGTVRETGEDGFEQVVDGYLNGSPLFMLNAIDGSVINPEQGY